MVKIKLLQKRKGMTLIELMIVVVIIGIVFAYAFVNAGANTEKARYARATEDIAMLTTAAVLHVVSAEDVATALGDTGLTADPILCLDSKLSKKFADMKDPWGAQYNITVDTDANKVTINCPLHPTNTYDSNEPLLRTLYFPIN